MTYKVDCFFSSDTILMVSRCKIVSERIIRIKGGKIADIMFEPPEEANLLSVINSFPKSRFHIRSYEQQQGCFTPLFYNGLRLLSKSSTISEHGLSAYQCCWDWDNNIQYHRYYCSLIQSTSLYIQLAAQGFLFSFSL